MWRVCPRCDEILEENFPGSTICPRCGGSWISQGVLDAAFGDPTWPNGAAMWWRRELECPECKSGGKHVLMDAIEAHGVIVDHCAGHGMWFDASELARVTNVAGDPFEVLRERLALSRPEIEVARASYDRRREEARLDRQALRDEAAIAEQRAAEQEAAELEFVAQRAREKVRAAAERHDSVATQQREITQAIAHHEAELIAVRRQTARLESDLATLRERLRELSGA